MIRNSFLFDEQRRGFPLIQLISPALVRRIFQLRSIAEPIAKFR
jgi:hypothetical protein